MTNRATKFDWYARLADVSWRGVAAPLHHITAALDWASYFIEDHADQAELAKWQPAHLLRPTTGLAWRVCDHHAPYPALNRVRGFVGRSCAVDVRGAAFFYLAGRDGFVTMLTGGARAKVLAGLGLPVTACNVAPIPSDKVCEQFPPISTVG